MIMKFRKPIIMASWLLRMFLNLLYFGWRITSKRIWRTSSSKMTIYLSKRGKIWQCWRCLLIVWDLIHTLIKMVTFWSMKMITCWPKLASLTLIIWSGVKLKTGMMIFFVSCLKWYFNLGNLCLFICMCGQCFFCVCRGNVWFTTKVDEIA